MQVGVFDIEWRVLLAFDSGANALACEDAGEGSRDVEVQRVAELIEFRGPVDLDAGSLVARVVTAKVGTA